MGILSMDVILAASNLVSTNDKENKLDVVTDAMILKISEGDMVAFEQFYRATDSAIYGYVLSFVKEHHEAKDLMQETYIKVRNGAKNYKPSGKPMAWVFTIARNLAMMKLRKAGRETTTDEIEIQAGSETFEDAYIESETLRAALNILDAESRQIVILYCVTGLKHKEIAEHLNMNQSTVISKYNRSLKKLSEHLKEIE